MFRQLLDGFISVLNRSTLLECDQALWALYYHKADVTTYKSVLDALVRRVAQKSFTSPPHDVATAL